MRDKIDVINDDKHKVCQVEASTFTVEIKRGRCVTRIRFRPDGGMEITNSSTNTNTKATA